jgi:hypothetical protein
MIDPLTALLVGLALVHVRGAVQVGRPVVSGEKATLRR